MQARERSWESYAVETERQREREREREREFYQPQINTEVHTIKVF